MDIPVIFSKGLASAVQRDDGLVEATFMDGTKRLTQILFGADGAHSKTRGVVAGDDAPNLQYTGVTCLSKYNLTIC